MKPTKIKKIEAVLILLLALPTLIGIICLFFAFKFFDGFCIGLGFDAIAIIIVSCIYAVNILDSQNP